MGGSPDQEVGVRGGVVSGANRKPRMRGFPPDTRQLEISAAGADLLPRSPPTSTFPLGSRTAMCGCRGLPMQPEQAQLLDPGVKTSTVPW